MNRTATGSATNQNIGAAFVDVATVAAPFSGSREFRVVIKLTALNAGHNVQVRETQGANGYLNQPQGSGGVTAIIEVGVKLAAGDTSYVVAIKDLSTLSTTAAWAYEVYELEDTGPQTIAQTILAGKRILFVNLGGNDSNDGLTPQKAFALPSAAAAAAAQGDLILVGRGVFDVGTAAINLPANCMLRGAGKYATTIQSGRLASSGPAVLLGNDCEMEDLSLIMTSGVPTYAFCVGFDVNSGHTPFTRAVARRCYLYGPFDVVVLAANSATPAACTFKLFDCHVFGGWDTLVMDNWALSAWDTLRVEAHNTVFEIDSNISDGNAARCLVVRKGTIVVRGGMLHVKGSANDQNGQIIRCLQLEASPSRAELWGVDLRSEAGASTFGSTMDIDNTTGGTVLIGSGTNYDRTKVLNGSTYTVVGDAGVAARMVRGAGYIGDFKQGSVVRLNFSCGGLLTGTPLVRVYKDASTAEFSTGITLTAAYDNRLTLVHVDIDTSLNATQYSKASNFEVVLTQGTVDGVDVKGMVVGAFSLENRNGGVSVTIGPIVGSRNPTNSVGSPVSLEMFQTEAKTFALTVLDGAGAVVDLSSKTLRFLVETQADPAVAKFDVEKPPITVSGVGNNIANVPVSALQSAISAGTYDWRLWDAATDAMLLWGTLQIMKAIKDVA